MRLELINKPRRTHATVGTTCDTEEGAIRHPEKKPSIQGHATRVDQETLQEQLQPQVRPTMHKKVPFEIQK